MADNIQVTQGTGTVMATDDIGSVQYPRVKVSWGVDGSAVDASATNPFPVDTLAALGVSRLVAMGATSTNLALTTTTRRVSIHATVAGFYAVGTGAQTASSTSHYIGAGERLDFDVAANTQIAAIRSTTDGTLYISELVAA
jgi:hypothetical protein